MNSPDQPHDHSTPIVRLCRVGKIYHIGDVEVPVLNDVNLDIAAGETTVVVGPSGSGKSTLLNLVGGIDRPTAGEIWFAGRNLATLIDAELTAYRRASVGFVFQFYNLVPTLTARENVMVATQISSGGLSPDDALRMVGMEHRLDHFPAQLSGGEQQRVAIARAVAKNPKLLLCDEPTGALDLTTGRMVLGVLDRLKQKFGMTIVIITHNSAIAGMADQVVSIGSGTIAESHQNSCAVAPEEIVW